MNRVVLDAELRAKLTGGAGGVEFTDENGNVVGHFLTHDAYCRLFEILQRPLTRQEVGEARKEMLERGGVSTADILEAVEAAKRDWESRR